MLDTESLRIQLSCTIIRVQIAIYIYIYIYVYIYISCSRIEPFCTKNGVQIAISPYDSTADIKETKSSQKQKNTGKTNQ